MNIHDYIASGVLEMYVAGQLSPEEEKEVEALAEKNAEVRQELKAIRSSMEAYAMLYAQKPPDELLDKIMRSIEAEASPAAEADEPKVKPLDQSGGGAPGGTLRWWAVAASVLLIGSAVVNVFLYTKWQNTTIALHDTEQQLAEAQEKNAAFAETQKASQSELTKLQNRLALVNDPNYKVVTMQGTEREPDANVTVAWNRETGEVKLFVNSLSPNPPGKQYQLWALKDGQPKDMGVFDASDDIWTLKSTGAADAFAVTLEPEGGRPTPTLENLTVLGEVGAI